MRRALARAGPSALLFTWLVSSHHSDLSSHLTTSAVTSKLSQLECPSQALYITSPLPVSSWLSTAVISTRNYLAEIVVGFFVRCLSASGDCSSGDREPACLIRGHARAEGLSQGSEPRWNHTEEKARDGRARSGVRFVDHVTF